MSLEYVDKDMDFCFFCFDHIASAITPHVLPRLPVTENVTEILYVNISPSCSQFYPFSYLFIQK